MLSRKNDSIGCLNMQRNSSYYGELFQRYGVNRSLTPFEALSKMPLLTKEVPSDGTEEVTNGQTTFWNNNPEVQRNNWYANRDLLHTRISFVGECH